MKLPKICIVIGSFPPARCGIGDYTANLVQAMAAQNEYELSVLT